MIVPARRRLPRSGNYRRAGLGVFNPPQVPTYEQCDPRNTPCVMRNAAKSDAYDLAMAGAQAQNNFDQCMANAANAKSQEQYDSVVANCKAAYFGAASQAAQTAATPVSWTNPTPLPTAVAARGGQLTFSTSRGGTSLYVGDTWTVSISGASPNTQVTVSGSMPSGSFNGSVMGVTDASGNFSKSGTLDASTVGSWVERWAVGSVDAGTISFTVAVAPKTTDGKTIIKSSDASNAPGSKTDSGSPASSSFDLSSIPWWGWAAAAGVALFALGGKR